MSSRRTPYARRARLVEQWRTSGDSKTAFARRQGIHPRTFWGWCRSTKPTTGGEPAAAGMDLVPVRVVAEDASAEPMQAEVVLATGDRVSLRGGVTGELLSQLVTALRRPC